MARKKYTPEQIIGYLRQAEIMSSQGATIAAICKEIGITNNTYCRWRKEYGGMRVDQARRLKDLEKENGRLRLAVSNLTLDNLILEEANQVKY
jgi:transposase-like protein